MMGAAPLRPGTPGKCESCGADERSFELHVEHALWYVCEDCIRKLGTTIDLALEDFGMEREE